MGYDYTKGYETTYIANIYLIKKSCMNDKSKGALDFFRESM